MAVVNGVISTAVSHNSDVNECVLLEIPTMLLVKHRTKTVQYLESERPKALPNETDHAVHANVANFSPFMVCPTRIYPSFSDRAASPFPSHQ